MKTPFHVTLILCIAAISSYLNEVFNDLVEYKMQHLENNKEAHKAKRNAVHETLLADLKKAEQAYHEMKHTAVTKANKALNKSYDLEDKDAHICTLLLKGA